jgi:hypothetical protein
MAMSLSPASDALSAPSGQQHGVDPNGSNTNLSLSANSPATSNTSNDTSTSTMNDFHSQIPPSSGVKRKPNRRANTAERRATHNAVERQRRETLNGRFLDLATLLPNLSQIRRPSKSSIVNSSIAHIQASRRHRLIASRELKMLKLEADALRREVNEWRDRAGLPRVEEPVRGDAFSMVITGELEVIQGIPIEEEDEDAEDGFGVSLPMGVMPSVSHHPQQQVQMYNQVYIDEVEEEAAMLGAMYAQQQNGPIHLTSLIPSHHTLAGSRERSGSLTNTSAGSQTPAYELHHAAMQDFGGVPRMGGMGGAASFVPSHHHMRPQGHGMGQPQAVSVGGGANAVMMMMM